LSIGVVVSRPHIVVGVDGSPGARAASQWAADECRIHGCTLLLVMVADSTTRPSGNGWRPTDGFADQLLTTYAAAASARQPGVPVTTRLSHGEPVDVLVELSRAAQMLIVGTGGLGVDGTALGSVGQRVAKQARCPVVVVSETWTAPEDGELRDVVVGVSSEHAHATAAHFAADEAKARGVGLQVVPAEGGHSDELLLAGTTAQLIVLSRRADDRPGMSPDGVARVPCPVIYVGTAPIPSPYCHSGTECEGRTR
jgi:nucleotide-binding universal stress UspA family protein